ARRIGKARNSSPGPENRFVEEPVSTGLENVRSDIISFGVEDDVGAGRVGARMELRRPQDFTNPRLPERSDLIEDACVEGVIHALDRVQHVLRADGKIRIIDRLVSARTRASSSSGGVLFVRAGARSG